MKKIPDKQGKTKDLVENKKNNEELNDTIALKENENSKLNKQIENMNKEIIYYQNQAKELEKLSKQL